MAVSPQAVVLSGNHVATISGDVQEDDLALMDRLVREYGAYRLTTEGQVLRPGVGIGEGIPVGSTEMGPSSGASFIRDRILNNGGTELIFPPRVDLSVKADSLMQEHGSIYGRPGVGDTNATFRGLYTVIDRHGAVRKAEGQASEDLVMRVHELQARRFGPVARKLFGAKIVVAKMLFANVLLPGQEISMHHDVPEFRGIHPRTCPSWLQVAMHGSGLFERWRILQAAGLTYYRDTEEGSLAVYCGPDGEGTVIQARRGLGVVVEAETCPHHSDTFEPTPGRPPLARWPAGVRLQYCAATGDWAATSAEGAVLERFQDREVRVSTQLKLHCFRDEDEYRAYTEHSDDLHVETAIGMLTEDLRRRGCFAGPVPCRGDLAVMMIKEYVRWPTPAVVAKCWSGRPNSVFARALAGGPGKALADGQARAKL